MSHKSLTIAISVFVTCVVALFFIVDSMLHPAGRIAEDRKSPTGQFTALVEEHIGTLAHLDDGKWDHDIYIRNDNFFGSKVRVLNLWGASRANGAAGVDIEWAAPDCLKISYCNASNNPGSVTSVLCGLSTVKIQISKGVCAPAQTSAAIELNNKAYSEIQLKHFDKAIVQLETCLKMNPQYALARHNLAVAHNNRGMSVANSSLSKALKEFYTSFYLEQSEISLTNIEQIDEANSQEKVSFRLHRRLSKEALLANDLTAAFVELELAAHLAPDAKLGKELADLEGKIAGPDTLAPSRQMNN